MLALGVHGMSVLTAVTAQNSLGVQGAWELPVEAVRAQYRSVVDDIGVQAVKTGMLASAELVEAVAELIAGDGRAGGRRPGGRLQARGPAAGRVRTGLRTDAAAARWRPSPPRTSTRWPSSRAYASSRRGNCARPPPRVLAYGPNWALIKGGHLPGEAVDLLTDGSEEHWLRAPRHDNRHTHGTGCTLASAIASRAGEGRVGTGGGGGGEGVRHRGDRGRVRAGRRDRAGGSRLAVPCVASVRWERIRLRGYGKKPVHRGGPALCSEPAVAAR